MAPHSMAARIAVVAGVRPDTEPEPGGAICKESLDS